MRASSLLATVVIGVVCTAANARASEPAKKSTSSATAKTAAAPPVKPASPAKETKSSEPAKPHPQPEAKAAPTPSHGPATTSAHGTTTASKEPAAGAPKQRTVTVAATADAPKQETLEEIVARVRRRLAMDRAPQRGTPAPAAARAEAPPRVSLVWRPYVVWPDELTGAGASSPEPALAGDDRVTLKWESDER